MAGELLLDTGAVVGLLDRGQTVHQACADFYGQWDGQVVTSEAVITESTHLLSGARGGSAACIDRKSTRLNSSHIQKSRMPSSA